MDINNDRRLWSITAQEFSRLVFDFSKVGIYSSSARNLQKALKDYHIYPARDFSHRCQPVYPDIFITYHSLQNFVDLQVIAWQILDFTAELFVERRPDLDDIELEPIISNGIRFWFDFLFIDQNSRDIRSELDVLPILLKNAKAHFVLGDKPLTRAWCCYEMALFNQRCVQDDIALHSFIAPTRDIYFGWDTIETTELEDKVFIEEKIRESFPSGFGGFNHVMNQANAVAILPTFDRGTHYTPAAIEALGVASEAWFTREITP